MHVEFSTVWINGHSAGSLTNRMDLVLAASTCLSRRTIASSSGWSNVLQACKETPWMVAAAETMFILAMTCCFNIAARVELKLRSRGIKSLYILIFDEVYMLSSEKAAQATWVLTNHIPAQTSFIFSLQSDHVRCECNKIESKAIDTMLESKCLPRF